MDYPDKPGNDSYGKKQTAQPEIIMLNA